MRYAGVKGFAFLVLCLAVVLAPRAARAALPPHLAQRIQTAAYESRAIDQRYIAMAQQLNNGALVTNVARQSDRHASAAMSAAVIGSISKNPALTGEIVATAVAAAPERRESTVSDAIKAFPGFAPTIAAAAGVPAGAPAAYGQAPLHYGQAPAYYGETPTYYAQAPAAEPLYAQPPPAPAAAPVYGQAALAIGAPEVGEADVGSAHDYTARLRLAVWSVFVEGEYETVTSRGRSVSATVDGDLGYDDPYPTFNGEASFRWGKHDFWITGVAFDQSESAPINVEIKIGDEILDIGSVVDTEVSFTDINFRYGYSFFEFEEDGFRLGPTVAVSYTDFSLELTELTINGIPTGRFSFDETLPVPTIGVHAEVPYGNFLFSTHIGALYFNISDFEATGIRAEAGVTWRPYDHVGFFAGLHASYVDLELDDENINDLLFWGPAVGLELRF